jgi:hypothetical protein
LTEDLREILHLDPLASGPAVEAFDGKRIAGDAGRVARQPLDR